MLNHINFIDTHIHLWDLNNDYPWIQNNENHDLKQNYLIENLMNDAKGLSLKKFVHIQAEISEKNKIKETEWLQKISDSHPLSFPNAIVGLSDHSTSIYPCIASVALGARVSPLE